MKTLCSAIAPRMTELMGISLSKANGHDINWFVENWVYPKAALGEYLERHALQAEYATYEEDSRTALAGQPKRTAAQTDRGGAGGPDREIGGCGQGQELARKCAYGESTSGAANQALAGPSRELSAQSQIAQFSSHEGSWVISNREPGITGAASAGRHPRNSSNDTNFVTDITSICASLHSLPDEKWGRDSFGDKIRRDFAVELKSLTAGEARYLANFRDADALRGAISKARLVRENRLLGKGVKRAEVGCELTRSSASAPSLVSGSEQHRPTIEGSATGATSKPAIDILGSVTQQRPRYGRPQEGGRVAQ